MRPRTAWAPAAPRPLPPPRPGNTADTESALLAECGATAWSLMETANVIDLIDRPTSRVGVPKAYARHVVGRHPDGPPLSPLAEVGAYPPRPPPSLSAA